jgi:LysR family nitrogen assimilation transcriptional regulator
MDVRQLKYFISIIDFGSLSKAAGQLGVAQPALSHQIASLEVELGKPLLVRTPRGVTPTDAGGRLYRHARTIIGQIEQAKYDIMEVEQDAGGTVTIGLPTSTAMVLALPILTHVRTHFPAIHLQLVEGLSGHLTELLANNRLDLAIIFRDRPVKGIEVEPLLEEDLFFATQATRPLAAETPMSELAGIPFVLPSMMQSMRVLIDKSFARLGVELKIVAEIDSLPTIRTAVAAGVASAILPQSALWPSHEAYKIGLSRLIEPGISRPIGLCRPEGRPPTAASDIVADITKRIAGDLVTRSVWGGTRHWAKAAQ